jgi:calcium-dependent protein kinase
VAPEVLNSQGEDAKYGVQCDVFSAGVILYILLTGEPLFDAKVT